MPGDRGGTVYLTAEAMVLDLRERATEWESEENSTHGSEFRSMRGIDRNTWGLLEPPEQDRGELRGDEARMKGGVEARVRPGCAVWIWFEGANPLPLVEARGELPGKYNFFLGNDHTKWRTEVPAFGEVVYRELWPGVDLVWHIEGVDLVYEVVPQTGANPGLVRFRYEGEDEVSQQADESVVLQTSVGFQVGHLEEDIGRFRWLDPRDADGLVSGERENPTALLWSTILGESDEDYGTALSFDPSGKLLVTGYTWSFNFPTTPGAYDESYNGGEFDVFVTKLDTAGSSLLWSTFLGGSNTDAGEVLMLDPLGNPVVTGSTYSSDFPTIPGGYDESHNGNYDVFVAKLDTAGSSLLWSTFLGGGSSDNGYALSLDYSGNPVVTGTTYSSDFPTTAWAYDGSHNGYSDVFIAKLDLAGSSLLWSTFLGGSSSDRGLAFSLDPLDNPVVTGYTYSSNFPTTLKAYDESYNGSQDAFVAKFNALGSRLLWSTFLGGSNVDAGYALSLAPPGNPVVIGSTSSSNFPITPGAYDETYNGYGDAFVGKFDIPEMPHFAIPYPMQDGSLIQCEDALKLQDD